MTTMTLQALRTLVADDTYASSFQSMGHYRGALLRHFDNLDAGLSAGDILQSIPTSTLKQLAEQSGTAAAANADGQWEDRYNTGIKPWSFRLPLNQPLTIVCDAMQAELNELRAAVSAGRTPVGDAGDQDAAVAAIQFALEDEDGLDFLSYWNEGEFDAIRRNWKNVPETVFIGADPLHQATRAPATSAGELDAARLAKLLELCTDAKTKFGRKGDLQAITMIFKASVRTGVGYRDQLRKLIDDMKPTFAAPSDRTAAKGADDQGGAA